MRTVLVSSCLAALIAATSSAQDLGARSFFPTDYHAHVHVDLEALRGVGFWDGVERSIPFRTLLGLAKERYELDLDDVDRLTCAIALLPESDAAGEPEFLRMIRVFVLEGQPSLRLPESFEGLETQQVGMHTVLTDEMEYGMTWVSPGPGTRIIGTSRHVLGVLEGDRIGGVPHPELLAFMSRPKAMVTVAAAKLDRSEHDWERDLPFPSDWLDRRDPVEFFAFHVEPTPEDTLLASVVVRFAHGRHGPEQIESKLRETIDELSEDPRLRALRPMLERIEFVRDREDLIVKVDLGEPDRLAGMAIQLIGPWLTLNAEPVMIGVPQAKVGQRAVIRVPAEPVQGEAPPAKDPKGGKR